MAAPVRYSWDDASAPVITGQNATMVNALSKILVDGYGSKAAAGWSKPYTSGTDYASFRQGSGHQRYLAVNDTDAQMTRVIGYESMSDATSGTGPFPTSGQISGGLYVRKSITADSTARPWICWATARTFYMWIWGGIATSAWPPSVSAGDANHFGFGQTIGSRTPSDAYNTFLIAATDTSTTSTTGSNTRQVFQLNGSFNTASAGHYMPRDTSQSGSATGFYKRNPQMFATTASGSGGTFPTALGELLLDRWATFDAARHTNRGYMPGMWYLSNAPSTAFNQFQDVAQSGSLNGTAFVFVYTASSGVAIATNDWGEP